MYTRATQQRACFLKPVNKGSWRARYVAHPNPLSKASPRRLRHAITGRNSGGGGVCGGGNGGDGGGGGRVRGGSGGGVDASAAEGRARCLKRARNSIVLHKADGPVLSRATHGVCQTIARGSTRCDAVATT